MRKHLEFHNKLMEVNLSDDAVKQSQKLNTTLIIEVQVYFSCLLGKRLAYYTGQPLEGAWQVESEQFSTMLEDAKQLTENIYIRFNTVMTKECPVSDYVGPPPVTDFTIKNQTPYVPGWLNIDFSKNLWSGNYGWSSSEVGHENTKQVRGQAIKRLEQQSDELKNGDTLLVGE
jgi:hypothetical protein